MTRSRGLTPLVVGPHYAWLSPATLAADAVDDPRNDQPASQAAASGDNPMAGLLASLPGVRRMGLKAGRGEGQRGCFWHMRRGVKSGGRAAGMSAGEGLRIAQHFVYTRRRWATSKPVDSNVPAGTVTKTLLYVQT